MATLLQIRRVLLWVTKNLAVVGPTLARVVVGMVFVQTGWGKLHGLDGVTSFFVELGIPAPHFNAVLVASTEFFGGLMFLLGLGARFAALPLAFTMVIAVITAKIPKADGWTDVFGWDETLYFTLFIWVAFAGAGMLSFDQLIARAIDKRTPAPQ